MLISYQVVSQDVSCFVPFFIDSSQLRTIEKNRSTCRTANLEDAADPMFPKAMMSAMIVAFGGPTPCAKLVFFQGHSPTFLVKISKKVLPTAN
jgi:hypothetical protein